MKTVEKIILAITLTASLIPTNSMCAALEQANHALWTAVRDERTVDAQNALGAGANPNATPKNSYYNRYLQVLLDGSHDIFTVTKRYQSTLPARVVFGVSLYVVESLIGAYANNPYLNSNCTLMVQYAFRALNISVMSDAYHMIPYLNSERESYKLECCTRTINTVPP